jgi:hypothetical protein
MLLGLWAGSVAWAEHGSKVGGYEQYHPGALSEEQVGAGWGHRSMTYGMMNMMSGMATQVATIIRSGKSTPEMQQRLAEILDHMAEMLKDAPAYMMGAKVVDSHHLKRMQEMLKGLEAMRKETGLR